MHGTTVGDIYYLPTLAGRGVGRYVSDLLFCPFDEHSRVEADHGWPKNS